MYSHQIQPQMLQKIRQTCSAVDNLPRLIKELQDGPQSHKFYRLQQSDLRRRTVHKINCGKQ